MAHQPTSVRTWSPTDCFAGGGEMGALMSAVDWSQTPLGAVESWSPTLQMMTRMLLANRFQMVLWWGPQFCQLYNDAFMHQLGTKHPHALGQPGSECWAEIWHIIGPLIEKPFHGGAATWMEDIFLEINRHGFMEETHWTIAYSPVPDDTVPGGIGGVLGTVHDITEKIVGERRVLILRDLGSRSAEAKTTEEACAIAAETLAHHPEDVPFALLYLMDDDHNSARLCGAANVPMGEAASPLVINFNDPASREQPWPVAAVVRDETMQFIGDLQTKLVTVPPGPWSDPPRSAVVLPIRSPKAHQLAGLLILGISSRLRFDDHYRGFCELVTSQMEMGIANARAYEEERKRAEALAAIDRAKTAFFSNVSHEFRTPLTLMLGPLEDLLAHPNDSITANRAELELIHRNGLRMLKLVNTLLDFSRLEAGRMKAEYEPTDLAGFTADLASVFRSAMERAGLRLTVECPPLAEPVYVDHGMWEKIVLNLLSNAFKFTFAGEVAVALRQVGQSAELTVADTGTGIPASEMPRLFERFHRIEAARGRTFEGSGIGLALVQDLAKLHGGSVGVESVYGHGSRFTVSIPLGWAHLPSEDVSRTPPQLSVTAGARAYVEEALQWLPEEGVRYRSSVDSQEERPAEVGGAGGPGTREAGRRTPDAALPQPQSRILLADDNADMRRYVHRLLAEHYTMQAVGDGAAALAAALADPPDLVLTDIMMPDLDGTELLKALRANPRTRDLPVILLSARAGEEERVVGLEAGADDYLIKPFSARELLARVDARLEIARLHHEAEAQVRQLNDELERRVEERTCQLQAANEELRKENLKRMRIEARLHQSQKYATHQFREIAAIYRTAPVGLGFIGNALRFVRVNQWLAEMNGVPAHEHVGHSLRAVMPGLAATLEPMCEQVMMSGTPLLGLEIHGIVNGHPGEERSWRISCHPVRGTNAKILGVNLIIYDVTEHKRIEQSLRESEERFRSLVDGIKDYAIFMLDPDGRVITWNDGAERIKGYRAQEILGQHFSCFYEQDDIQRGKPAQVLMVAAATGRYEEEGWRVRKDGSRFWANVIITALKDETGKLNGFAKLTRDMTARKQAEEALRDMQAELARAARRMTMGELTASIAHEINQPLTAVITNANACSRLLAGESPDLAEVREAVGDIAAAGIRASEVIARIRALLQKTATEKLWLNLNEVIQEILSLTRSELRTQQILVQTDLPAGLLPVLGDRVQLQQVLLNLMMNGIEAMAMVTNWPRMLLIRSQVHDSHSVLVAVQDSGVGLNLQDMDRLFNTFFTTKSGGMGMGLAISRSIIEAHGGRLWAAAHPGPGATFYFTLPAGRAEAP